ncbi:hypothetical protein M8J77_019714 [Diaphorina citri]|nr:hypothetical protein M8J77_019714 [Diaphorina citri]
MAQSHDNIKGVKDDLASSAALSYFVCFSLALLCSILDQLREPYEAASALTMRTSKNACLAGSQTPLSIKSPINAGSLMLASRKTGSPILSCFSRRFRDDKTSVVTVPFIKPHPMKTPKENKTIKRS